MRSRHPGRRSGRTRCSVWLLAALLIVSVGPLPAGGGPTEPLLVGAFSRETPGDRVPSGWQHLTFPRVATATAYDLVASEEGTVVRARSAAGASALVRPMAVDLERFPVLVWRWRVDRPISSADIRSRSGDDCPARLYVSFQHPPGEGSLWARLARAARRWRSGGAAPDHALNYIWSARETVGTLLPSAYAPDPRMVVVETGEARLGRWVGYRRNVAEDYRRIFGRPPPAATGVAIMSDTDDTGADTLTYFGDIRFVPEG